MCKKLVEISRSIYFPWLVNLKWKKKKIAHCVSVEISVSFFLQMWNHACPSLKYWRHSPLITRALNSMPYTLSLSFSLPMHAPHYSNPQPVLPIASIVVPSVVTLRTARLKTIVFLFWHSDSTEISVDQIIMYRGHTWAWFLIRFGLGGAAGEVSVFLEVFCNESHLCSRGLFCCKRCISIAVVVGPCTRVIWEYPLI